MTAALRLGLLAGEASGDVLGASLMAALRQQADDNVECVGIGGPRMQAEGLELLADFEQLSVNGFVEPIKRLPSLLRLLADLTDELSSRCDVFVGVDFNVFNLLLERRLKQRGVPTVHYVSPSVYAWRRGRIRRMAKACSRVLCLYPFEPALYRDAGVDAVFVGHPLADAIRLGEGAAIRLASRDALGIADDAPVLAVLPGSRSSEIDLILPGFAQACIEIAAQRPGIRIVIPSTTAAHAERVGRIFQAEAPTLAAALVQDLGDARRALGAADVALIKSGTSTLEAMLLGRPMVVSYRLGRLTAALLRPLLRTPHFALPNILAGEALVPELIQDAATPSTLAEAVLNQWRSDNDVLLQRFQALHSELARDAGARAAEAVLETAGIPVEARH